MLRPLKIIVGNMIVNAIISFYWQTQRDRHVKPHPTEIQNHIFISKGCYEKKKHH